MHKIRRAILLITAFVTISSGFACAAVVAESGAQQREYVAVTVYSNNQGLVRDVRTLKLPVGKGELRFRDVAAHVDPVTVRVRSISQQDGSQQDGFTVIEQIYEYDLMHADKLLDKYVGRNIAILDPACGSQSKPCREVSALLLSNNQGQVFQIDGRIYLGFPGIRVLPKLPEALVATPTLTWQYRNNLRKTQQLEVTYLTGKMNWKADYVLALNKTDTHADLSGWVTIDNLSGAAYHNAGLKLVAGSPHKVQPRPDQGIYAAEARMAAAGAPAFSESELFEYHVYNLQGKTDLKNNQAKQIKLLEAAPVRVVKSLQVNGSGRYFQRTRGNHDRRVPVAVYIQFDNNRRNKLGRPLPAGVMRLYKADTDGSYQYIGEDRIGHTPAEETVKLRVGEAFDVVAHRQQTDYRKISDHQHESAWKITLKNRNKEAVTVAVVESLPANWRILKNSHPFEKTDAFTITFQVPVPKQAETTCTYRLRAGR